MPQGVQVQVLSRARLSLYSDSGIRVPRFLHTIYCSSTSCHPGAARSAPKDLKTRFFALRAQNDNKKQEFAELKLGTGLGIEKRKYWENFRSLINDFKNSETWE